MKLTKDRRDKLDMDVLDAMTRRNGHATYVLRNHLDRPGKPWHRAGLATSDVLRSCRRLEKQGLVEEDFSLPYAVMKSWKLTDAGRDRLNVEQSTPTWGERLRAGEHIDALLNGGSNEQG